MKNKKLILLIPTIVIIAIIILNFNYRNKFKINYLSNIEKNDKNLLIDITREELNERISKNENIYVYIGRPTCPDCKEFEPKLKDILNKMNKKLLYYNTEAPASQKQEIRNYLEKYNVKTIPCILYIEDGKTIKLYDCQNTNEVEEFIEDFKGESIDEI